MGETPNISEYLDFEFSDWVLFWSNAGLGKVELAGWLGISHRVGQMMSDWLLRESGIPISATTVQQMTNDEQSTGEMRSRISKYEDKLKTTFELPTVDQSKIIE